MNHPVVQITYDDAMAFAKWKGEDLPTEAQWERAARYPEAWGGQIYNKLIQRKTPHLNNWQGPFPSHDTAEDGFSGTAPVGCFAPNALGIYDLLGNVWELVSDQYSVDHHGMKTAGQHVIKGGSYLCTAKYCMRYRPSARQPSDHAMGISHVGFRTVINLVG